MKPEYKNIKVNLKKNILKMKTKRQLLRDEVVTAGCSRHIVEKENRDRERERGREESGERENGRVRGRK